MSKFFVVLRTVFSLMFIYFLMFSFSFFMDGEMGITLISFVTIAIVFSISTAFFSRKNIKVDMDCELYVRKDNEISLKIDVSKKNKLPLAFVDVVVEFSEVFENKSQTFRLSLAIQNQNSFEYKLKAVIGGNGFAKIVDVYSVDYFGFFKFKALMENLPNKIIGVIPEIPEINSSNNLFKKINNDVLTTDDDEENENALSFSANSNVGYDHREYVYGDSLNRVNWKISSKKSKLLVRLDELSSSIQPSIIINLSRDGTISNENAVLLEEKIICSVFGLLNLLIKQGIGCKIYYNNASNEMKEVVVDSLEIANQTLLNIITIPIKNIISDSLISAMSNNSCVYVIATTNIKSLLDLTISLDEKFYFIVPKKVKVSQSDHNIWFLNENNNFEMV